VFDGVHREQVQTEPVVGLAHTGASAAARKAYRKRGFWATAGDGVTVNCEHPHAVGVPRCDNCEAFVTEAYVAVFAPDGRETVRTCPHCEDVIRDGADVRPARAPRG
jgi:hypothetical protein